MGVTSGLCVCKVTNIRRYDKRKHLILTDLKVFVFAIRLIMVKDFGIKDISTTFALP